MADASLPRVVLDTNTVLRGVVSETSASARLLDACRERRVLLLLSKGVVREYLQVLSSEEILALRPGLTVENVETLLGRLRYRAESFWTPSIEFVFDRDPRDAMFIELAIAGRATHIISHDKDLLSLPASRSDAGRRFRQRLPSATILNAADFVAQYHDLMERPRS